MSFKLPDTKPSFGIKQQRAKEDSVWKALRNNNTSPFTASIPNFRSKDPQLPLYKDKPLNNQTSSWERRKIMFFKAFILGLAFYTCYYIGGLLQGVEFGNNNNSLDNLTWKEKQDQVRQVFKETWKHYETDAWGKDEYHPLSHKGKNMGPGPLGWIIVDSLDTMHLMGLEEEFKTAEAWVANELNYDMNYEVNVFETTIRMLGGLLSAHYLSKNDMFLEKAVDLGNRIIGAFDSPSGIPYASVNLHTKKGVKNHVDNGASSTAEVATLQLEFKYLSKLTGESLYWEKVEKIMEVLDKNQPKDGLVPIYVHPDTGKYQGKYIRLGSRADSYYEYLIKQYLQTDEQEPIYNTLFHESNYGIKKHLLRHSKPSNLVFFGELERGFNGGFSNKMDHLVCFIGGSFALGATGGEDILTARKSGSWTPLKEEDFTLGKEITHTCWKTYEGTATGLSSEIVVFNDDEDSTKDFYIKPLDRHNLQRPETVESLFILYRITKDPIYREWGWKIFQSFVKHTKTADGAFTSLSDVTTVPPKLRDNMESFWIAETLKYLYLLFDDENLIPLTENVFNTEGHPFPRFDPNPLFKTGWSRDGSHKNTNQQQQGKPKDQIHQEEIVIDDKKGNSKHHEQQPPKLNNAPVAAEPAKPALEQLKDLNQEPNQQQESDDEKAKIKAKLAKGENVNEIIEELIDQQA
ncbi:mannosyl-oligosaccharide alpha-1,2-mannosidase [Wickerhamomyces ciferrii]|uniref:alpha-1,2-Mannosidase n=1 Tax=Wickerhamomyces ciferrii (strain ATCC 14091 / BCRC 22168 / CBS 111 / JCM 3599 / NBRC 0793 / NRRL Y-1031 F-60-10) TaxID=1206466 RepID=K0KSR8_WICCF|nr:mannosyl-oligosaccharide alpha-1,2-mannosidase [Wickerhamomyces ciferrii]CCH44409.1 mannosyl-oligosaccharide alpha-1,2-mannosidase [Wickerhamomyces ciferrii]